MDNTELDNIREILKSNPKGLTIAEIAKLASLNRISTSKYLNILQASGHAEMRVHGPSKVFYPSQRVPISTILNFSSDMLIVLDDSFTIIDVNNSVISFFSLERSDFLGHRIEYSPFAGYISSEMLTGIKRALDSQGMQMDIHPMIAGRNYFFRVRIIPTVFDNGRHGVTLIFEDITELTQYRLHLEEMVNKRSMELAKANEVLKKEIENHKKARTALKESERKYRELVENANSIILKMDPAGNIIFFNEYAQVFFGFSEGEILGKNIIGTILPRYDSAGNDTHYMIHNIIEHLEQYSTNLYENIRKNGERVWISWTNKRMQDALGHHTGILCIGNDITEQKRADDKVRASEQKLSAIIDFLPDATFVIDNEGAVIAWNRAMEQLTGVRAADIMGKGSYSHSQALYGVREPILVDFALNPDLEIPEKYHIRKRDAGTFVGETCTVIRGKQPVWLWGTASCLYDETGAVSGAIESMRDVTEIKQNELALRESEHQHHEILETRTELVFRCLPDFTLVFVNEKFCQFFKTEKKDLIGKKFVPEMAVEDQKAMKDFFNYLKPENPAQTREIRLVSKDGTIRWTRWNIFGIFKEDGSLTAFQGSGRDITREVNADELIRKKASETDGKDEAIIALNFSHRIIFWNHAAEKLYGWSASEIIRQHIHQYTFLGIHTLPKTELGAMHAHLFRHGVWRGEMMHRNKSGDEIRVDMSLFLVRDEESKTIGVIAISRPVKTDG